MLIKNYQDIEKKLEIEKDILNAGLAKGKYYFEKADETKSIFLQNCYRKKGAKTQHKAIKNYFKIADLANKYNPLYRRDTFFNVMNTRLKEIVDDIFKKGYTNSTDLEKKIIQFSHDGQLKAEIFKMITDKFPEVTKLSLKERIYYLCNNPQHRFQK